MYPSLLCYRSGARFGVPYAEIRSPNTETEQPRLGAGRLVHFIKGNSGYGLLGYGYALSV